MVKHLHVSRTTSVLNVWNPTKIAPLPGSHNYIAWDNIIMGKTFKMKSPQIQWGTSKDGYVSIPRSTLLTQREVTLKPCFILGG